MWVVGLPELLIAAVAERERVTVLHYNGDYELIAQVTWPARAMGRTSRNGSLTGVRFEPIPAGSCWR